MGISEKLHCIAYPTNTKQDRPRTAYHTYHIDYPTNHKIIRKSEP